MQTASVADQNKMAVDKTIRVNAPQAHAFAVFTERLGAWWPLESHHIGAQIPATAIIEPRVGGRWFERASDGTECDWGSVLVWEPPERVALAWNISAKWQHDPALDTRIEIRFIAEGPQTTRIELEHRQLEAYGDDAEKMRSNFDSDGGWSALLRSFAEYLAGE